MGIESIFSKSWSEFKSNIPLALKITFWFFILPCLFFILIIGSFLAAMLSSLPEIPLENNTLIVDNFLSMTGNVVGPSSQSFIPSFFIVILLIAVLFVILTIFNYFVLMYLSVYNDKGRLSIKQAARGTLKYFWKLLGLAVLISLFILVLFLVPILLGVLAILTNLLVLGIIILVIGILASLIFYIYLLVKWLFAPFVLLRENTGILESMRRSGKLSKGKWWKTLGYILLFSLIVSAISTAIYMAAYLFLGLFMVAFFIGVLIGPIGFVLMFILGAGILVAAYSLLYNLLCLFSLYLFKNLYLELRTGKIR